MEDQRPNGQTQDAANGDQGSKSAKDNDTVSYESYSKVVGANKGFQELNKKLHSQLEEANERLKQHEQTIAEKEGRKDDVIEALRKENAEIKEKLTGTTKTYAGSVIKGQLKAEAIKHGCVNPDKLIKLLGTDELNGIDINDDFTINADDLERVITKAKEEHSDIGLFGTKKVNVHDINNPTTPNSKEKTMQEMSKSELEDLARATLK